MLEISGQRQFLSALRERTLSPLDRQQYARWLLLALVALQFWLIFSHVPWGDEIQAWLIVRESPTLGQLLANLKYEGHPALWYVLIWPFPTLRSVAFLQAALAMGTLALIWFRSPFPSSFKLLLAASYFVLFEYGVLARSYSLGATLFFAFIAFRNRWWAWALLALMANISAHFMILSAICAALIVRERGLTWYAAIWIAGCALSVLSVFPAPPDVYPAVKPPETIIKSLAEAFSAISMAALPVFPGNFPVHWSEGSPAVWQAVVALVPAMAAPLALRQPDRPYYVVLLFSLIALAVLVYPIWTRHTGMLFLLYIGLEWIRVEREGELHVVTRWWTGALFACGMWIAICSIVEPFTPGPKLAGLMRQNSISPESLVFYPGFIGLDETAQTGRPTYNLEKGCFNTFIRWDHPPPPLPSAELRRRLNGLSGYLVTDERYELPIRRMGLPLVAQVHSMLPTIEVYRLTGTAVPAGPRCR